MLKVKNLTIQFGERKILETSFEVKQGIVSAFIGESGSGKSSLFNILSLYKYDQSFDYYLDDVNLRTLTEEEIQHLQKTKISYLTQQPHFIDALSCKENLVLECEMSGSKNEKLIDEVLNQVGLLKKKNTLPKKLSGGEKQRLAIACAMIKDSDVIICDEITSSLDNTNTEMIMNILLELAHDKGKTVLVASHEKKIIKLSDEVYEIKEGTLEKAKSSEKEEKDTIKVERKKGSKGYLKKLAFARMKKKKSLFLILVAVVSIVVSSVTYFYTWTSQRVNFMENMMQSYLDNALLVINRVDHFGSTFYHLYPPFEDEFMNNLKEIEEIKSIYPIYCFSIFSNDYTKDVIEIKANDETILEVEVNRNDFDLSENIFAYYEEENIYNQCEIKGNTQGGIYVHQRMANLLGISNLDDNPEITFSILVPVAFKDYQMTVYFGGGGTEGVVVTEDTPTFTYLGVSYVYERMRVTLPISGILPMSYSCLGVVTENLMMISNDTLNVYIEQCSQNHESKEGEYPLSANNIRVFLEDDADRETVISKIEKLSEDVFVIDSYENYVAVEKAMKEIQMNFMIPALMVAGLSIFLLLAYSFQHRKDVTKDYYFLNIRGVTKQERKTVSLMECVVMGVIFSIFSTMITYYLLHYGVASYPFITGGSYEITKMKAFVFTWIISFIAAFICESTLLFERR